MRAPSNGKCSNFINANCSYNCPNAALEAACNRWDLDPGDFGIEYIECKECYLMMITALVMIVMFSMILNIVQRKKEDPENEHE